MTRDADAFQGTKHDGNEGQAGVADCKDPGVKEFFGQRGVMQGQGTHQKSTKVDEETKHKGIECPSGTVLKAVPQPGKAQKPYTRTQHCPGEDASTLSRLLLHRNHDGDRQP